MIDLLDKAKIFGAQYDFLKTSKAQIEASLVFGIIDLLGVIVLGGFQLFVANKTTAGGDYYSAV